MLKLHHASHCEGALIAGSCAAHTEHIQGKAVVQEPLHRFGDRARREGAILSLQDTELSTGLVQEGGWGQTAHSRKCRALQVTNNPHPIQESRDTPNHRHSPRAALKHSSRAAVEAQVRLIRLIMTN